MADTETLAQWLAGLKVGDEVAVFQHGRKPRVATVAKVDKASVTIKEPFPSIRTVKLFKSPEGLRGRGLWVSFTGLPVTQEIRDSIETWELLCWLQDQANGTGEDEVRPTLTQLRAMKAAYEKDKP